MAFNKIDLINQIEESLHFKSGQISRRSSEEGQWTEICPVYDCKIYVIDYKNHRQDNPYIIYMPTAFFDLPIPFKFKLHAVSEAKQYCTSFRIEGDEIVIGKGDNVFKSFSDVLYFLLSSDRIEMMCGA
jgi:hypothetical protein